MKKFLVLALVALVAGAAFADTDPVFSGSFSTYWAYAFSDADAMSDDNSLSMSIDLGATIDDYNTVSVSVGLGDGLYWDDVYDDDLINVSITSVGASPETDEINEGDELVSDGNYLMMNSFTLCTDLTGALGVDAPVSVSTKMGDFGFGTVNVANVAPLGVDMVGGSGADGGIGVAVMVDVMDMITLGTVVYPVSLYNEEGETGVTLQVSGIADMIDVAAYFMASEWDLTLDAWDIDNEDFNDDEGLNMGASVKASVLDGGLCIGAGFAYDMTNRNSDGDKGVAAMQFEVAFSMVESLVVGLSYGSSDLTDFAANSEMYFSATYDVLDNLGVYAGFGMPMDFDALYKEDVMYDCGITTSLKALAIQVGFSNDLDFKAPEDDFDDAMFVKFSTSF